MHSYKKYSEEEIVALLKNKDQQAFACLYDTYAGGLNNFIRKMVKESQLAEDILQEVFMRIWNNIHQYDDTKGRLFTWMINISRNLTIDILRSRDYKKQQKISKEINLAGNYQDKNINAEKFDCIGLQKQVSLLKPAQKNIIQLAYFNGYTQLEISKEMGIPVGTVKTRMRSAILKLRAVVLV